MSLVFPEGYVLNGSFEGEALSLVKRANATETFHSRVIIDYEDPFNNPAQVIEVTNKLGARIPYEGDNSVVSVLEKFHASFCYDLSLGKFSPASVFYKLATTTGEKLIEQNKDHPGVEYYIDPSLLKKAYYGANGYWFFLVPLEKTDLLRKIDHTSCKSLNLSLNESSKLSDIPTIGDGFASEIQRFREYIANDNITSPSICLIAIDNTRHGEPFPQVFIYAKPVRTVGYFPVLFGLKPVKEKGQYLCVPSRARINEIRKPDLVKRAIGKLGINYMAADKKSVVDWKELLATLELFKEGYELGRDEAIRSRKADELAGD